MTPIVPLPLKVFAISAGALRTSFVKFLGVIVAARVIRYFGLAYLGLQLGKDAEGFLRRNGWTLAGAALLVGAAYTWGCATTECGEAQRPHGYNRVTETPDRWPKKIAIVEDEAELAALIDYNLARHGYQAQILGGATGHAESSGTVPGPT